ncbi:hypothetical protein CDIK_0968 [Cucumispora dikerogammari]|nr:hypothetical protein CDIK_0968 [Cucumispora dikerogammari]
MHPYHSLSCTFTRINTKSLIKKAVEEFTKLNLATAQIISKIESETDTRTVYSTVYKALVSGKESAHILLNNSYAYLNSLIDKTNSNLVFYDIAIEDNHFKRLFITWQATKYFYKKIEK